MNQALVHLLAWLDLEPSHSDNAADIWRGNVPGGSRRRLFGGHVAAQALVAAGRCTPDALAHSIHVYFLRLGDPHTPIEYRVERLRDGRSFSARLVRAVQHNEEILVATVSFVKPEQPGLEHQVTAPVVPPPAACMSWEEWSAPRLAEMSATTRAQFQRERPIEIRPVNPVDSRSPTPDAPAQQFWLRAPAEPGQLADQPLLHQALAAYASDHTLLSAVLRPHGVTFMSRGVLAASVDHTIWFHRPFRMDQWLLYSQIAPVACAGRGLALGHFFDEQGNLLASMAQEGVLRQY
jgi:acyl-CoA thioesterase-2